MDEKEKKRKNQPEEMQRTDSGDEELNIRRNKTGDSRREAIRRERMEARRRQVRRTYMMLGAGVAAVILLAGTLLLFRNRLKNHSLALHQEKAFSCGRVEWIC